MEENTNIEENINTEESAGTEENANIEESVSMEDDRDKDYKDPNRVELTHYEFDRLLKKQRATGRGQGVLITLAVVVFIVIASIGATLVTRYIISGTYASADFIDKDTQDKAGKLWAMIEKNFLWDENIDKEKAEEYLYKGMLASLDDPYSVYYTKDEYNDLIESFEGEYSGIGAYVSQNASTGETYIAKPMPGSPAEEAGLLPDDRIVEVNGESMDGLDLNVIVSKIKGPQGTTVDIGIYRQGATSIQVFTVERRVIEVIRVEGKMLDDKLGYILISEIEESTLSQFEKIYSELKSEGMEGLVLDLRDNPGGDLNVVVKLADKFLDEGIIVYTKNKNGKVDNYKSDAECEVIPMVVLVNANTASAAEILSGSLKERGVAKVIGTNTFGKGIVQSVYPLIDGSGLKLTESEYFLENDTKIHGIGVIPDVEIKLDRDAYLNEGIDNQLEKAVEVLKGELK